MTSELNASRNTNDSKTTPRCGPEKRELLDSSGGLQRSLKPRHLRLIALGGIIGAGLFVGSGTVIARTGPAAIVSYALGGILVIAVMRMLGEMTDQNPSTGSFMDHARREIGARAGFLSGWLYWYFWVIVVAFEATAGASIIQQWIPQAPLWLLSLALTTLLLITNLISVRSYGEFEYWFASIKIFAIVAFIIVGFLYVFDAWPRSDGSVGYLVSEGGFTPNGWTPVLAGVVTLIFTYVGSEIVTIAAGESKSSADTVRRTTTIMVVRVLLFYIASIVLLVTITPWSRVPTNASPFAAALSHIGVPFATTLMNAVVLTAVLSCLNSGLYVASRMLFAMTANRDAPRSLAATTRRGVPVRALLVSSAVSFASVVLAYVSPDTAFYFLTTSSGAVILVVYLLIVISHLKMSRQEASGLFWARSTSGRRRMPPWTNYLAATLIVTVIASLSVVPDTRPQLLLGAASVAALLIVDSARTRRRRRNPAEHRSETTHEGMENQ